MKPDAKFTIFNLPEHPDKFMLIRMVGDYATHYMDPQGAWIALPEDDQDLTDMFAYIKETGALPEWELVEPGDTDDE